MHPLKTKAVDFRLKGMTYSDINKLLNANISKSTLSGWFKDLILTKYYSKKLQYNIASKLKTAQLIALKTNRKRRLNYLDELKNRNLHLLRLINLPIRKLLLSTLYLAEGAKHKNTPALTLGSSNPNIIKLYINLLGSCYKVRRDKFRARIQCRADQDLVTLKKFWRKETRIPKAQFYPTYIDKRTIGKPTLKSDYKGVCTITYFSTEIQLELELLAESVIESVNSGPVVQW